MIFILVSCSIRVEFTPVEVGYTPVVIYKDSQVFPPIFFGVPLWEPPMPYDPYSFPILLSYKILVAEVTFDAWKGIHLSFGSSVLYTDMLVSYNIPVVLGVSKKICKGRLLYFTSIFPLFKIWSHVKSGGGICFYDNAGYLKIEIGVKHVPEAYWGRTGYVYGFYLEIISGFKWRLK